VKVYVGGFKLVEESAPYGYSKAEDYEFSVNADGTVSDAHYDNLPTSKAIDLEDDTLIVSTVSMIDDSLTEVKIGIEKVDADDGTKLTGATLKLWWTDGPEPVEIGTWTSNADRWDVSLFPGNYALQETAAPDGYAYADTVEFTVDEFGGILVKVEADDSTAEETTGTSETDASNGNTFTRTKAVVVNSKTATETTQSDVSVLQMEDKKIAIPVGKVDVDTKELIAGAHLQVVDEEGTVVDEWTTTEELHTVTGLKAGAEYQIIETERPDGYATFVETPVKMVVNIKGGFDVVSKFNAWQMGDGSLLVLNKKTSVKISKSDIASGEEVEGATIQLLDKDGKLVDEWVSGKEPHEVVGLNTEETYTLRETVAPFGYGLTTDTVFELDKTGEIDPSKTTTTTKDGVLLVEDTLIAIPVGKVDVDTDKLIAGAHLQVVAVEDGTVVDEWTTTEELHTVTGLKAGAEYEIIETKRPDGYANYVETPVKVIVNLRGGFDVVSKFNAWQMADGRLLVLNKKTSVTISKTDITGSKELEGAQIQILDQDGNVVEEWISSEETHTVTGLNVEEVYTLRETVAPAGYKVTSDTVFALNQLGNIDLKATTATVAKDGSLVIEDDLTTVKISKTDIANGEEVEGATIQLLDKDGKVVEEWVSGKEPHEIVGLTTEETYTLRETVAPSGYDITTDTVFVLDKEGKIDPSKTTTTTKDGILLVEDSKTELESESENQEEGPAPEETTVEETTIEETTVEETTTQAPTTQAETTTQAPTTQAETTQENSQTVILGIEDYSAPLGIALMAFGGVVLLAVLAQLLRNRHQTR
jgi:uncharacterized surface anchored protein